MIAPHNITLSRAGYSKFSTSNYYAPPGGGSGSGWRGNEPAGMTYSTDRVFGSATDSKSDWWTAGSVPLAIVSSTGSTYDDGNGTAGRVVVPAGAISGNDAQTIYGYSYTGQKDFYLCMEWKCSSNWQDHSTGTNKIFYISQISTGANPMFLTMESSLSPRQFSIRSQGMATYINQSPNLATVTVNHGQYYLVEIYIKSNTSAGSANGETHMWVNGTKTTQFTGLNWHSTGFVFDQLTFNSIWGGGGDTASADMYQDVSRLYYSTRA